MLSLNCRKNSSCHRRNWPRQSSRISGAEEFLGKNVRHDCLISLVSVGVFVGFIDNNELF
ncbi:hypothetical protein A1355_15700 [Methylomonas koyamae]|uniref:Uncharacterized protein n=1 Tax=Methylomonas koyamae TaxID=702114 RepID=A0A177N2H8_9GAMM|nr:hypothetical protein A1355_15700 [Methylomonas koyamae]